MKVDVRENVGLRVAALLKKANVERLGVTTLIEATGEFVEFIYSLNAPFMNPSVRVSARTFLLGAFVCVCYGLERRGEEGDKKTGDERGKNVN